MEVNVTVPELFSDDETMLLVENANVVTDLTNMATVEDTDIEKHLSGV